jgi:hypothetical protein
MTTANEKFIRSWTQKAIPTSLREAASLRKASTFPRSLIAQHATSPQIEV